MKKTVIFLGVLLSVCLIYAEEGALYEGEILPGQKGYCVTEMANGKKEKIELEIIGTVKGSLINQSYILVRMIGENISKYGVAAGMSGSPVYLDNKIMGAVAFTYAFQKENLAGVTLISDTIEQCNEIERLNIFKIEKISIETMDKEPIMKYPLHDKLLYHMPVAGINNSGSADMILGLPFSFNPVDIPSFSSSDDLSYEPGYPLEPGDTFGLLLMKGDVDIAAYGTVTYIDSDRRNVYALGHPAFSLGSYNIPITRAETIYTVPSNNISFKVAENTAIIGTMVSESDSGVKFSLDDEPQFIPLRIEYLANNMKKSYNFEMASFKMIVPSLYQIASFSSLQKYIGTYNTRSIDATVVFNSGDGHFLKFRNLYNGFNSFSSYITEVSNILSVLLFNEFNEFPLESIDISLKIKSDIEKYSLINCNISSEIPNQGEKIDINMLLTSNKNHTMVLKSEISVPDYFPDSKGMIIVCDYQTYIFFELMRNPARFTPGSYDELISLIEEYPGSNKIYIMLYSFSPSFSLNGRELNNLPVFYEKMMELDQSLVNKHNFSLQKLVVVETDFAVTGGKAFPVEIFYK